MNANKSLDIRKAKDSGKREKWSGVDVRMGVRTGSEQPSFFFAKNIISFFLPDQKNNLSSQIPNGLIFTLSFYCMLFTDSSREERVK